MCIAIENRTGKPISEAIAKKCVEINQDGFGIVYLDESGERMRTLDMDFALRILTKEKRPYVAHCRFATVGEVCKQGIHPFPIGGGRYLFQNGTVDVECTDTCDTAQVAKAIKGLSDDRIKVLLHAMKPTRFIVANAKSGKTYRIGSWVKHEGVHYSKSNVLPWKRTTGYTPSHSYSYSHGSDDWDRYGEWWDDRTAKKNNKGIIVPKQSSEIITDAGDLADGYSIDSSGQIVDPWDAPERFNVAVYGTLKYGRGNHHVMGIANGDFVGHGSTAGRYRLYVDGLPYLLRGKHKQGQEIQVEVYQVDAAGLGVIDALESHPDWYKRETITINMDRGGTVDAYCYFVSPDSAGGFKDDPKPRFVDAY